MCEYFKIREFDPSTIEDNKTIVFIGKRNTGKSFLMKDILYYHKHIPLGTVISATEKCNKYYRDFVPSIFIHHDYNDTIPKNVLTRQEDIIKKRDLEIKKNGSSNMDIKAFFIMDDCMFNNKWVHNKDISYLFLNGRHMWVFFLLTLQTPLGLPPVLRENIDYVFILKNPSLNARKKLYMHYASIFPSFEFFCQVMDKCTENYECLVISNTSITNKLEDCVFWYKAKQHNDFKMCLDCFWQMSKVAEDEEDNDRHQSSLEASNSELSTNESNNLSTHYNSDKKKRLEVKVKKINKDEDYKQNTKNYVISI